MQSSVSPAMANQRKHYTHLTPANTTDTVARICNQPKASLYLYKHS